MRLRKYDNGAVHRLVAACTYYLRWRAPRPVIECGVILAATRYRFIYRALLTP